MSSQLTWKKPTNIYEEQLSDVGTGSVAHCISFPYMQRQVIVGRLLHGTVEHGFTLDGNWQKVRR